MRSSLAEEGFEGWVTFAELAERLTRISTTGGVYVVLRDGGSPEFLDSNPGGRFKDRDPSIPDDALRANWVGEAPVVYIGKADNLRRRLREFMRFGEGRPIGHWGGRLIWQLADSATLQVAWKETPGEIPKEVETSMISAFRSAWDKPPFANDPHRLGT
jgi:hypothetical protein